MQVPQELDGLEARAITWPSTWIPDCVEHIAAVDPGETTGVAILHRGHRERDLWLFAEIPYDPLALHNALMYVNRIIIEPFTVRSNDTPKANYCAVEVVGAVKLTARLQGIPEPMYSQPSNIQGNGTRINERWQKESMLWMPNMIHANDAARHLIHWLIFREREPAWLNQHATLMKNRLSAVGAGSENQPTGEHEGP